MENFDMFVSILGSTVRLSIPLIFTALAGLFSERAGIFDIGLEGKMLAGAFAAACVAYLTGSAWAGLAGSDPRLCLDHQSWQSDYFWCVIEFCGRRSHGSAGAGVVQSGRAHTAIAI
jgi:hypothetical protein